MQSVYALHNGHQTLLPGQATKILQKHFDATIGLFLFLLYHLVETARYAETSSRNRASKFLPSEADKNVPVKIAGNSLLWRIMESDFYKAGLAECKPQLHADPEWIRKLYTTLSQSTLYDIYNETEGREKKSEREILEFIFTDLMMADEDFTQYTEDFFNNWDDDADMLRLLLLHFLQKPGVFKIHEMVGKEKWEFALQLLETVTDKTKQLDELIKPKLNNWDPERLAQIDTILLQLGVCEFLYFETIPLKVTINEYIDLAKEYSTHQSGQFINGILDNVRKELEQQGKIHKIAFQK